MISKSILRISATILSFVVIGQSIAIVETMRRPQSAKQLDVFVGDIVSDPETPLTATLWLESNVNAKLQEITLWADNSQPTQTVFVKLEYIPKQLEIMDQDPKTSGVQISGNAGMDMMLNQTATESGTIELLAKWQQPKTGKFIVATISAVKKNEDLTQIKFDYMPRMREGSYVSSTENGTNILAEPGVISF